MSKEILITGGAGYIGSHTILELIKTDHKPVIVDNLSTGHQQSVLGGTFYNCDLSDTEQLKKIFAKHKIDTIMHFGANCYIGESVVNPHKYFKNNVGNTINLLGVMLEAEVKKIIFSSSAAIYGNPVQLPMDEHHPQHPCNPYGMSKLFIEQIINTYENAYGIKHIYLRYFNAAGADLETRIGEDHYPETHIIPLLIQTAMGVKKQFTVFGADYNTKDGTCIRDYVHVGDVARAHIKAMQYLDQTKTSNEFNLGYSIGYSVKEIINRVEKITGKKIPVEYSERREGDPAVLIASYEKAKDILEWEPRHDIDSIIQTAWDWYKKYPKGFKDIKQRGHTLERELA
ncbi:MAG: UDP-glucose 4-epimerase GalE [Pseudomonadota bacterium]